MIPEGLKMALAALHQPTYIDVLHVSLPPGNKFQQGENPSVLFITVSLAYSTMPGTQCQYIVARGRERGKNNYFQ